MNHQFRVFIVLSCLFIGCGVPGVRAGDKLSVASHDLSISLQENPSGSATGFGTQSPVLRNFIGPEGHFSIELVEDSLPKRKDLIPFSLLGTWDFDPGKPDKPVPEMVQKLSGQDVALVGFVYPLEEGEKIRAFLLTASTQTCCYGPRPQYNQYLLVESAKSLPFEQGKPVLVSGRFFVEPKPLDGYIFRMEASTFESAPEVSLADLSGAGGINLVDVRPLDWTVIEALQMDQSFQQRGLDTATIPASFACLYDRQVLADGQLLSATTTQGVTTINFGKYVWDGCCTGIPPNAFNSVTVFPASGSPLPPPWMKSASIVGTFQANLPSARYTQGIFGIRDARFLAWSHKATGTPQVGLFFTPPIISAADRSDAALVRLLVRGGANLNDRNRDGLAALHISAMLGVDDICRILLEGKAAVNVLCPDHQTPLHKAAGNGRISTMAVLASGGADLNFQDRLGMAPLSLAVANVFPEAAEWLIVHGADIQVVNQENQNLLHLAVIARNAEIVKFLIERGVPKSARDKEGKTPLQRAMERNSKRLIEVLKSHGVTE